MNTESEVRLSKTYDVERLRSDLELLEGAKDDPQPGPYHDGEWRGISLFSSGGMQSARPSAALLEPYQETNVLKRTPYFKEILDGFLCRKQVVRLLALAPGGEIKEHFDFHLNFQAGLLRLHLPIITHPDVLSVLDNQPCTWLPGELWYGDFSRDHYIKNHSPITRVHMVIDVEINAYVLGLFPRKFVEEQETAGITKSLTPLHWDTDELKSFECKFKIPAHVMPVLTVGRKFTEMAKGALAETKLIENRLIVYIDGTPGFSLEPVGSNVFSITGLSAGFTLEIHRSGEDVSAVNLIIKGIQKDLFAGLLGVRRGPNLPLQKLPLPLM